MIRERGLSLDHTAIYRWVQAYAPELEKRIRPQLRPTNDSCRVDETYVKIKGEWKYLYRAVDSTGQTIDFMLSRRNPELLYFPTVHVHDREVHWYANFDHISYCQPDAGMEKYLQMWEIQMWGRSSKVASEFMNIARSGGIVDSDQYCWRLPLKGLLPNKDTLVGEGAALP